MKMRRVEMKMSQLKEKGRDWLNSLGTGPKKGNFTPAATLLLN